MEVTNPQQNPNVNQPTQPIQPMYGPPPAQDPVSVGEWVLTMLIMVIPLVNLIMLFVWAFGSGAKPSKANWAKASLVWMLIGIVIAIIFGGAIIAAIAAMAY